jgi:hypothetical protein
MIIMFATRASTSSGRLATVPRSAERVAPRPAANMVATMKITVTAVNSR